MKTFTTFVTLLGLGLFTVGCSQEAQVDQAREDFQEERADTFDTMQDVTADGVITPEDRSEIADELAEDREQAGEVIKQEAQLDQERIDDN